MLAVADGFFDFLHVAVILFNLFGWAHPATRLAHRVLVGATAFFWCVAGPLMDSPGYCPLTEWHWQVKEARGVQDLPNSYIDHLLQLAGIHADARAIDIAVGAVFAAIVAVTAFMWWRDRRRTRASG